MKTRWAALALLTLLWPVRAAHAGSAPGAGIAFIVNQANTAKAVSVRDLVDYYEKKKRRWPDGTEVRFVDQTPGSPERALFIRNILGRSESDVEFYWFAEKLRSGSSAPIQLSGETLVIEMVRSFAGAIGYVSPKTSLGGDGIRTIEVTGLEAK